MLSENFLTILNTLFPAKKFSLFKLMATNFIKNNSTKNKNNPSLKHKTPAYPIIPKVILIINKQTLLTLTLPKMNKISLDNHKEDY